MAFIIQLSNERACPRVQCDHCHQVIDDPSKAIATWEEPTHAEGNIYPTKFHHKGCDLHARPKPRASMPLDEYLVRTLDDLGRTPRKTSGIRRKL